MHYWVIINTGWHTGQGKHQQNAPVTAVSLTIARLCSITIPYFILRVLCTSPVGLPGLTWGTGYRLQQQPWTVGCCATHPCTTHWPCPSSLSTAWTHTKSSSPWASSSCLAHRLGLESSFGAREPDLSGVQIRTEHIPAPSRDIRVQTTGHCFRQLWNTCTLRLLGVGRLTTRNPQQKCQTLRYSCRDCSTDCLYLLCLSIC